MYFSEAFAVEKTQEDDWFDPLLEEDTRLFVDPFLVFAEEGGTWGDCDNILSGHFERSFELLAGHHDNPESVQYRKTVDLMKFPEPAEMNLGFVGNGTDGSGTGIGFARRIVRAMGLAIEAGLADLKRFEELGVLVDRIGRDRISDITCNLLKERLISYTQEICERHDITVEEFDIKNAGFDQLRQRWTNKKVLLPRNPKKENGAVILVPKRFLRELPTLNSDDWWDYIEPTLRDDLNWDTSRKLPKEEIIRLAQKHPDWVREWTNHRASQEPDPYDVDKDPEGLHKWQFLAAQAVASDPITLPQSETESLSDFVRVVNEKFRHFVEERGGWELLYNDDTGKPKRETSIQLLYRGVIEGHCQARHVFLDREINLGRGPVDFVFTGLNTRVLMEIKKFRNGEFWNGLEHQLTSYLTSEQCSTGWFLAVRFTNSKTEESRHKNLSKRTTQARASTSFDLHSLAIDARKPISASNITSSTVPNAADDDPEYPGQI
jgi:hypothetical protein